MILNPFKIEVLMAEQCISKVELARKCGISSHGLAELIRRGSCEPKTAGKLALGLGVQVEDILKSNSAER